MKRLLFPNGSTISAVTLVISILLTLAAQAIHDTNQNGVSDLWEKTHNQGNLYTDFDPTTDPDGDGWTNAQEATAGTHPFDAHLPAGFLCPEIQYISAVYLSPAVEGGESTLLSPATVSIRWNAITGKKYTVFASTDLTSGSWIPIGQPQTSHPYLSPSIYITLTQPDGSIPEKLFFRISAEDTDSDGDTLTDYEESQLGSSPYSADGDGDGLNDWDELFVHHTNPNSRDSDSDGVSDWDEIMVNFTNPLSGFDGDSDGIQDDLEKHLARQLLNFQPDAAYWSRPEASDPHALYAGLLQGDLNPDFDYTGEGISALELAGELGRFPGAATPDSKYLVEPQSRRNLIPWAYHIPASNGQPTSNTGQYWHSRPHDYYAKEHITPWSDFTLASLSQYLVSRIDSVEWGRSVVDEANTGLTDWDSGLAFYWSEAMSGIIQEPVFNSTGTRFQGNIIQRKFRVIATRADHEGLSQHFLKVTSKHPYYEWGIGDEVSAEPFSIEIPKGKFFSDWFEFEVDMVDGQYTTMELQPLEVAVDADRDGEITFDGKDQTTADKPFRFWINDDRDVEGTVDGDDWEEDDIYVHPTANGGRDTDSFNLEVARDLEDLTRVWIDFSGINSVFPASDSSVKLKVRIDSSSAERARIILYQPVETSGGRQYLKNEGIGHNQLQGDYGKELCRVGISSTEVPRRGWETLGADKVIHFLFEGLNKGDGKLIFELWKDGEKVCDLPPVNLLLKKATEMYETWTVGDVAAPGVSYSSWPASSATQTSGQGIPAPEKPEEKDYVMFVHGWNIESWEKETFASTMFKRMWHQGYKGRFGAYTWPTFHSLPDYFDTSHFDGSEERAWNSAAPLHALTASLAGTFKDSAGKSLVRLYAHSMGNVVASEALRQMKLNSSVHTYISAQAALSSHVWDNTTPDMTFFTPATPNVYGYHWQSSPTSKPHQWQPEGRPSYMAPINMPSSTVFINHYNPLDWALSYARWQLNQSLKPDQGYHYDNANPIDPNGLRDQFWESPAQVLSFPNNRFEIFAFAAESRAFATGQQGATAGMFDTTESVNLNGPMFQFGSAHKGHSAQFRSTIQKRWTYWTKALRNMDTQTPLP